MTQEKVKKLSPIDAKTIDNIKFSDYSAVAISDYNKGFLDEESIKQILLKCRDAKVTTFVDSKKKNLSCFEECIIKINKHEYNESIFLPSSCEIIITSGKDGAKWRGETFPASLSDIDNLDRAGGNSLRVANVSGAGDTFFAGLITEYLKSHDMKKSIKFANLCGSKAIEKFGTYVISRDDLK